MRNIMTMATTSGNKPKGKLESPKGVKDLPKLSLAQLYKRDRKGGM